MIINREISLQLGFSGKRSAVEQGAICSLFPGRERNAFNGMSFPHCDPETNLLLTCTEFVKTCNESVLSFCSFPGILISVILFYFILSLQSTPLD